MYSSIYTAVLNGLEAVPVTVEADVSDGMPQFEMVGFLSSEVREARERVRTALKNSGFALPPKHITVNLTPANIRKSGNACDLPVAAAVLAAFGYLNDQALHSYLLLGEVSLDGRILPVSGVLASIMMAREQGFHGVFVPQQNAREASILDGIHIIPIRNLQELCDVCSTSDPAACGFHAEQSSRFSDAAVYDVDFCEVHGQELVKRAFEISASGMHNLLVIGPPGSGKSMLASRMMTILPELTMSEKLELSKIYSVAGLMEDAIMLRSERPFRAPHHTITVQAMAGGGKVPMPGEISLAHHGVLFLDELPEYHKEVLESLREPLEDKKIRIARNSGFYEYPSDFLLLAAMNPCKCGYYPDMNRCICTNSEIQRYVSRISVPLLDRMDLCVETQEIGCEAMRDKKKQESSVEIRERVTRVHALQCERFKGENFLFNSQMPASRIEVYCPLKKTLQDYIDRKFQEYQLTMRAYYKILRVARTIADMEGTMEIQKKHIDEALFYRSIDRKYWTKIEVIERRRRGEL